VTTETIITDVLDPVSEALAGYGIFTSSTPASFDRKMAHVPSAQRSTVAVIMIDVLRATTTIHACIAAGSRGVVLAVKPNARNYDLTPPFGDVEDWIYGGEENGLPIPGGAIGNSPLFDEERNVLVGRYLKFYSTNGARALAAIDDAGVGGTFLASLANIELTVLEAINRGFEIIWLVCGGFYGSSTLEDTVCAGRGIRSLLESGSIAPDRLDDESRIALHTASGYAQDDGDLVADLRRGQVGILLRHIGREADLQAVVGRGMNTDLWRRMGGTVVVCRKISGVSTFVSD
jgi:phosphosulfolactate phosphohydrolase-like enzyme